MPTLKNSRHEKFAQLRAKGGMSVEEAHVAAGFTKNRSNASRLNNQPEIVERIAELQERAAEKAEWTVADRLAMLADIARANHEADPRSAIAAIAEANRMQGSHAPAKVAATNPEGTESVPMVAVYQLPSNGRD